VHSGREEGEMVRGERALTAAKASYHGDVMLEAAELIKRGTPPFLAVAKAGKIIQKRRKKKYADKSGS